MILGEIPHRLRAATRNCIYEVAIIESGTSPPPTVDILEWPIYTTPNAWKKYSGAGEDSAQRAAQNTVIDHLTE